ncbi:NADH:flavin oxidoreductase/NADH oxidase [Cytidiella melzeri]|nr:NADH:flavin oxidoreductase/NADH oxidase [Cytidiella melzeri]
MAASNSALFQPYQLGDLSLQHRIVMAPLTRLRASTENVPQEMSVEYYSQRASVPGTLIIAEGSFIAEKAGGMPYIPGLWTEAQIAGWKKIVDAVHSKGCFIFAQIAGLGRSSTLEGLAAADPSYPYIGAGDIPLEGRNESPRPLTVPEIREYTELFATAAKNAVEKAGFDGVEIHGANGYLVDQFIQTNTNNRTDEYGGSIENRIRFPLEIIDAVVKAVGEKKCAIKISPWSRYQNMRMPDPVPTFKELAVQIRKRYPAFAYLHVVEPRVAVDRDEYKLPAEPGVFESNDEIREAWGELPFLSGGGYDLAGAIATARNKGGLVVFGRHFLANPDLVARLRKGSPLNQYNRATFYLPGSALGYTDYPFMEDVSVNA